MLKENQMFLKCFYNNAIKIVLILAPGREFFRVIFVYLSNFFKHLRIDIK